MTLPQISDQEINHLKTQGFLRVPNVLTSEQVQSLRTFLSQKFSLPENQRLPHDKDFVLYNYWGRYPELRWLLYHEPIVHTFSSLLGKDYVMTSEVVVLYNIFGGWHKDSTSQEKANKAFHKDDHYAVYEVALYLQDNCDEYGGGLDVIPGTHRQFFDPYAGKKLALTDRISNKITRLTKSPISIPSKAGDLMIFHHRLSHRATQKKAKEVPPEHEKIGVFMAVGKKHESTSDYQRYIWSRPDYNWLEEYPEPLIQEARSKGVTLLRRDGSI
jgi:hypothetical protein